jgi:hypothetical protein
MLKHKHLISKVHWWEWMCVILIFYILALRVGGIFSYNTDLEGVEFCSVHFTQLFILKHHLYSDAGSFPYLLIVYTPLYYYVMYPIITVLSIDVIHDIHAIYITGRIISLALLFADFFILLKIIKLIVPGFNYRILLFLFFLLFIPIHFYTYRPDSFKVTCFLLFLLYAVKHMTSNELKHHIAAFVFMLLAILFKQDVLLYGFLWYGISFITTRKWSYVISIVLLSAILVAIIYAVYLCTGINFYKQLFVYNVQYDSDFHLNIPLILLNLLRVLPLLILAFFNARSHNRITYTLAVAAIIYFCVTSISMLRMGANINYTYESSVLLLLNAIIYFSHKQISAAVLWPYIFLLVITFINFLPFHMEIKKERDYRTAYFQKKEAAGKIQSMVKDDVLFLPNQENYIYYAASNLIYGYDWHYDRYCELNLSIRLKPNFAKNDIVEKYDKNFTNGTVQYIALKKGIKSEQHIAKYYPGFKLYGQVQDFLLYKFSDKR